MASSSTQPVAAIATIPTEKSQNRLLMFDAARGVGAIMIVWLHTMQAGFVERWSEAGRFAVPFFVAAACCFMVRSVAKKPGGPWAGYARARLLRLYLPFVAWTGIYLVARLIKHQLQHGEGTLFYGWAMLLVGSSLQLWFLPWLTLVSIGLFPLVQGLVRATQQRSERVVMWSVLAAIAGILWLLIPMPVLEYAETNRGQVNYFAGLAWNTVAAIPWGLAAGLWLERWLAFEHLAKRLAMFGLVVTVVGMVLEVWLGRCVAVECVAGLGWLLVGLGPWRGRVIGALAKVGEFAFGIYLSHALFMSFFQMVLNRLHRGGGPWVGLQLVNVLLTLTASLVTSWVLSRSKTTRWLLG